MHVFKIFQLKPSTYHQIVALGSKDSMLRICFFSAPTGVPYRARLHHAAHCQWDRPKSRAKHGLWTRTAPLLRCQVWWITACLKMGFTQWDSYNILKDLVGSGAPHSQTHLVDCIAIPVWWSHGRPVGSSHGTSLLQETPVVLWFYLQWSRWAFCGVLVGTRCVNVWKPETADFCHRLNFWRILGYWGCVDLVAWIIYYYIYIHISIIFTYLPSLFLVFETYSSSSSSYDVNTLGLVKRSQVAADDFADQLRKRIDARIYEPGAVITAPRRHSPGRWWFHVVKRC